MAASHPSRQNKRDADDTVETAARERVNPCELGARTRWAGKGLARRIKHHATHLFASLIFDAPARRRQSAGDADRASARIPPRATARFETLTKAKLGPRRTLTDTPRTGAHPFSSCEKTLQGREAVEENLYIRDKEAAARIQKEAELQAERLADASKAFKKEFSQELATMLHQKHLAERQKALRK